MTLTTHHPFFILPISIIESPPTPLHSLPFLLSPFSSSSSSSSSLSESSFSSLSYSPSPPNHHLNCFTSLHHLNLSSQHFTHHLLAPFCSRHELKLILGLLTFQLLLVDLCLMTRLRSFRVSLERL